MRFIVVVLGIAAAGMSTFLPAGLADAVARDLGTDPGRIHLATVAYSVTYAVCVPFTPALGRRLAWHGVISIGAALLVVAGVLGALAPAYAAFVVSRTIAAIGAATLVPVLLSTAAAARRPSTATGVAFAVLAAATSFTPDLARAFVSRLPWQLVLMGPALIGLAAAVVAFAVRGATAAVVGFAVRGATTDRPERPRPVGYLGTLAACGFWLLLTTVSMASAYTVFGRSEELATQVGADVAGSAVFGAGGVVATPLVGLLLQNRRRHPERLLVGALAVLCLVFLGFVALTHVDGASATGVAVLFGMWGAATWSISPVIQRLLLRAAGSQGVVAVGLNAAALYAGIGAGTALGAVSPTIDAGLSIAVLLSALAALTVLIRSRVAQAP
ncbi:MFS transporter [Nonomuraea sp. NPDC026600]|uniref:MFS transporter n=1 Tax=Nonomuraea sp. NPDC026600 TaxID=3155363 RepID=UPI0033EC620D